LDEEEPGVGKAETQSNLGHNERVLGSEALPPPITRPAALLQGLGEAGPGGGQGRSQAEEDAGGQSEHEGEE